MKRIKFAIVILSFLSIFLNSVCVHSLPFFNRKTAKPQDILIKYMNCINESRFLEMYSMLNKESQSQISIGDFLTKNKNIYEGIKAKNLAVNITGVEEKSKDETIVKYDSVFNTMAGNIAFSNEATFVLNENRKYGLKWSTKLIFPNLEDGDRIRISTIKSKRGDIYDRNGEIIVGLGKASLIGIVPEKIGEDRAAKIFDISKILDISIGEIDKLLSAPYVKSDTFVPIKTISKGQTSLEEALLKIPGIMIKDKQVRFYPHGEKASHLTGYVQNINKKELESLKDEGYNQNSVIGKSGIEKIYEKKLKGTDGNEIYIINDSKNKKELIARKDPQNGEDVKLTIDMRVQNALYDEFSMDKSASIAINTKTGEVLAMVSTPSFNSNDFIVGMSKSKWDSLNRDVNKPLLNRYKGASGPGSIFKPIVGAIGLNTRKIRPEDDYGHSGLTWQKDPSWGSYFVKTLREYSDISNLKNALIYSDNIYFAKAALNIGKDVLTKELLNIGFNED
ncbi:MAG: penicillin-binding transpeptidase domain-containing protein, partial [Oscillospiraceae bacterium]|nr:penicillin-binding transpeptidase domain-containing protein [Oscillospiraceae bacterium]